MAWPVLLKVGTNRYLGVSLDISTHGARVRTKARLKTGTTVQLELVPPEGRPSASARSCGGLIPKHWHSSSSAKSSTPVSV
jgi:PilZ domain.